MQIVFDTNFLIYCAKNKLDYASEIENLVNEGFEMVVPAQVVDELTGLKEDKLKKVSGKDKAAANLALQLLKHNKVKVVDVRSKGVDDAIIALAKSDPTNLVCTLDRGIRKKLGRVILINEYKKLVIK